MHRGRLNMNYKQSLALVTVALAIASSPARATTYYDYDVNFAIGTHTVTGSIQTDNNNGVLGESDISSWALFLDGLNGISSADQFSGVVVSGSSFIATPTALTFYTNHF